MSYEQIRDLALSFWTRYGVSWVLKLLMVYGGYDAVAGKTKAEQGVAAVATIATLIADIWHSRAVHQKALDTPTTGG